MAKERTRRTQSNAAGKPTPKSPPAKKQQGAQEAASGGAVGALREAITGAERTGITCYAIAKAAGLRTSVVARVADGTSMPRLDTAEAIAKVLGFDLRLCAHKRTMRA